MNDECIHAKLQLQLVVPEECLVRGDIGAWYACLQCGEHFRSDIKPYKLKVSMGTPAPESRCTLCPQCHRPLQRVTYPEGSMLNREQFDSVRAGDWYCETCKGNEAKSCFKYWWNSDLLAQPTPPAQPPVPKPDTESLRLVVHRIHEIGQWEDASEIRALADYLDQRQAERPRVTREQATTLWNAPRKSGALFSPGGLDADGFITRLRELGIDVED